MRRGLWLELISAVLFLRFPYNRNHFWIGADCKRSNPITDGEAVFLMSLLVDTEWDGIQFLDAAFLLAASWYTFKVRSAMTSQERES